MALVDLLQPASAPASRREMASSGGLVPVDPAKVDEVVREASISVEPGALTASASDPRAQRILAKTIYRELRQGGLGDADVMTLAGELLSLVTEGMRESRVGPSSR